MERIELGEYAADPPSASASTSTARDERAMAASEVVGTAVTSVSPFVAEEAGRLFEDKVGQLRGVLRIENWGPRARGTAGAASSVPTFYVFVNPDDRDTEYAVYEAQGQIYDKYPDAYLEVVVLEESQPSSPAASPIA